MRRFAVTCLLLSLLLVACSRPAPAPAPAAPEPPPPAPVVEAPKPPPEPEPLRITAWAAPARTGPWLPYQPGMHLPPGAIWLKLEATAPFPPTAIEDLSRYTMSSEGARFELADERTMLVSMVDKPVLFVATSTLTKGNEPWTTVYAGTSPTVVEVNAETGKATTLGVLQEAPANLALLAYDRKANALYYHGLQRNWARADLTAVTTAHAKPPDHLLPAAEPSARPDTDAWLALRSPNGKYVAVLDAPQESRHQPPTPVSLEIREAAGGKVLTRLDPWIDYRPGHPCRAGAWEPNAAWAPDSTHLAGLSWTGGQHSLHLLDVVTGQSRVLATAPAVDQHYDDGARVSWSPDGSAILFERSLANAKTGEILFSHVQHKNLWRPDGAYLLTADGDPFRGYGRILLVQTATGKQVAEYDGAVIGWTPEGTALILHWPNGKFIPMGPKDCM